MAREIVEVNATVGDLPVKIRVVEFPIIEDLVRDMISEFILKRRNGEAISLATPIDRDIKDFLVKTNVVGD